MNKRAVKLIGLTAFIIIGVLLFVALQRSATDPAPSEQSGATLGQSVEQQHEQLAVTPDINNEEFILVSTAVTCSSTELSESCSGNIRIIPTADQYMEAGLYKINDQTKLLHNGQQQDLELLQQLSENQTPVRLKLVQGSEEFLQEISY